MKRLILAFSLLAGATAHAERESYRPSVLAPSTTAGTILFDDGTAAAPSISFGADTNTGIYRRGTDQPSIALNGTERISFTEVSGTGARMCLGIGCSSASATSTFGVIQGTDAIGTDLLGANLSLDSGRGTGNRSGGAILFRTSPAGASGSTQNVVVIRMQIDGQEVIFGNANSSATPNSSTLRGTNGSGTNIAAANLTIQPGRGTGTGAGGDLVINTAPAGAAGTTVNAAVERMRILSGGNIGIGTASPLAKLHVDAGTGAGGELLQLNGDASVSSVTMTIRDRLTTRFNIQSTTSNTFLTANTGTLGIASSVGNMTFATNGVQRFDLTSAGVLSAQSGTTVNMTSGTFRLPNGTAIPATCTIGDMFHDTDSNDCANTGGGDGVICSCKATNTWALVRDL